VAAVMVIRVKLSGDVAFGGRVGEPPNHSLACSQLVTMAPAASHSHCPALLAFVEFAAKGIFRVTGFTVPAMPSIDVEPHDDILRYRTTMTTTL
jgi:hypothetical protein